MVEELDVNLVLGRLNRSSPDALLSSLASEIVRLNELCMSLHARIVAIEAMQTGADRLIAAQQDEPAGIADEPEFLDFGRDVVKAFRSQEKTVAAAAPPRATAKSDPFR